MRGGLSTKEIHECCSTVYLDDSVGPSTFSIETPKGYCPGILNPRLISAMEFLGALSDLVEDLFVIGPSGAYSTQVAIRFGAFSIMQSARRL